MACNWNLELYTGNILILAIYLVQNGSDDIILYLVLFKRFYVKLKARVQSLLQRGYLT